MSMMAQHWMLAWKLCDFLGDPDQYCKENLYFCDFSEGFGPHVSPLDPPMQISMLNSTGHAISTAENNLNTEELFIPT